MVNILSEFSAEPRGVLVAHLANHDNALIGDFDRGLGVVRRDFAACAGAPFASRGLLWRLLGTEGSGAEGRCVEAPEVLGRCGDSLEVAIEQGQGDDGQHRGQPDS